MTRSSFARPDPLQTTLGRGLRAPAFPLRGEGMETVEIYFVAGTSPPLVIESATVQVHDSVLELSNEDGRVVVPLRNVMYFHAVGA